MNWRSVKPLVFETEIEEFELKIKYKFPTSFKELIQLYNNTEDIPRLYRRRGLFFRSAGVQSPAERKQFFELPLLVKSRALNGGKSSELAADSFTEFIDSLKKIK